MHLLVGSKAKRGGRRADVLWCARGSQYTHHFVVIRGRAGTSMLPLGEDLDARSFSIVRRMNIYFKFAICHYAEF